MGAAWTQILATIMTAPKIYYVGWERTGNTVYRDRGHAMAIHYRDNYLRE